MYQALFQYKTQEKRTKLIKWHAPSPSSTIAFPYIRAMRFPYDDRFPLAFVTSRDRNLSHYGHPTISANILAVKNEGGSRDFSLLQNRRWQQKFPTLQLKILNNKSVFDESLIYKMCDKRKHDEWGILHVFIIEYLRKEWRELAPQQPTEWQIS